MSFRPSRLGIINASIASALTAPSVLRCGAEGAALLYGEAILRCTRGHRPSGDNHSWPRVLLNQPKSCRFGVNKYINPYFFTITYVHYAEDCLEAMLLRFSNVQSLLSGEVLTWRSNHNRMDSTFLFDLYVKDKPISIVVMS